MYQINPNNIPKPFHPLIPYVEKWAISDYTELSKTIDETPLQELKELVKTVSEFDAEGFDEWLGNSDEGNNTKEWRAFILLIDACDVVKIRMEQNRLHRTEYE